MIKNDCAIEMDLIFIKEFEKISSLNQLNMFMTKNRHSSDENRMVFFT